MKKNQCFILPEPWQANCFANGQMGIQGEVGARLIIASTYTRIVVKLAQSCPRELAVNFPETVRPALGIDGIHDALRQHNESSSSI